MAAEVGQSAVVSDPTSTVSACMQWMRSRGGDPCGAGGGERCTWSGHRRRSGSGAAPFTLPRCVEMLRVDDVGDMDACKHNSTVLLHNPQIDFSYYLLLFFKEPMTN